MMRLAAFLAAALASQVSPPKPARLKIETVPAAREEAVQNHLDAYFAAEGDAERLEAFKAAQKAGCPEPREVLEQIRAAAASKLKPGVPVKVQIPWLEGQDRSYFYLALPADYDPRKAWPLTLSLHGTENAPEAIMSYHNQPEQRYGLITLFPITSSPQHFWSHPDEVSNLLKLIAAVSGQVRVDPRRIFCYGGSGGGMGTWSLLSMHPE